MAGAAATTEPQFLTARRERAVSLMGDLEMPSFRSVAGWEFTPIDKLDMDAFAPAPAASVDVAASVMFELAGAVRPSGEEPSSEGPVIMPLALAAERYPDIVERHLGTIVTRSDPFTARNDHLWADGAFVYVPRGVHVEAPILLDVVHEHSALHWRTLIVLEEGAQAEVWEQMLSADPDGEGLVNSVVEIVVGQNANLHYVAGQDLSENCWIFSSQRAVVARDGQLNWTTLGFGSANGKVFLETNLAGEGAHAAVNGAYATHARQHLDFDTLQEHAAANTTSDLAFRGILSERSTTVWRGMIKVDEGAQQTDAFQESRNLLISKKAHADSIPGLEILADDVRCTHAAAIAQIDKDQLFYLRSRGLSDAASRRLVIEGFLSALVERFPEGKLRETVATAIDRRLERVLGA